jgi:hypothetical protein
MAVAAIGEGDQRAAQAARFARPRIPSGVARE